MKFFLTLRNIELNQIKRIKFSRSIIIKIITILSCFNIDMLII